CCGGGTDTLQQQVVIAQPCISVSGSVSCAGLGSATISSASSQLSYTWLPGGQNTPVANGLVPGTYTILIFDGGNNTTYTTTTLLTSTQSFTGSVNNTSVSCKGVSDATATVSGITGGSGNQYYLWSNGSTTYTSQSVLNLSTGSWSVTVTDALTSCQFSVSLQVLEP